MSDLELDFFKLNSPPKEEINYYPSFDFVDIIQSYLKIFNINADKSKLDTNLNEFILLIKDAIQKISENNYSGNLILNKLQKDYNETEMEKIIAKLSDFVDYIEYLKLINENEEVTDQLNIIKNDEINEDREKDEYRNDIIEELRFSLNIDKNQQFNEEYNTNVLNTQQKGGGFFDDIMLYQGILEPLDEVLKDLNPINIFENITGKEREKLREEILNNILKFESRDAFLEGIHDNDLDNIKVIKFDLFFSDFLYKYYLNKDADNYMQNYTDILRKSMGIKEIKKNPLGQIQEDLKEINSKLKFECKTPTNYIEETINSDTGSKQGGGGSSQSIVISDSQIGGLATKEGKKMIKKKLMKMALKSSGKTTNDVTIDIEKLTALKKSMERYILIQITLEDGSKEKIAGEWLDTLSSWLTLGSGIFDFVLEKEKPYILKLLGETDPKKKINNPFDLLLSFNDLLLGDHYSFARGAMRYTDALPIPKFLKLKKKQSKSRSKKVETKFTKNSVQKMQDSKRKRKAVQNKITKQTKKQSQNKNKEKKEQEKTEKKEKKKQKKREKMTAKERYESNKKAADKKAKEEKQAKEKKEAAAMQVADKKAKEEKQAKEKKEEAAKQVADKKAKAEAKAKAKEEMQKAKEEKQAADKKAKADKEKLKKRLQEQDNLNQRVKSGTLTDTNIKEIEEKDPRMEKMYKNQINKSKIKIQKDKDAATLKAKAKAEKKAKEEKQAKEKKEKDDLEAKVKEIGRAEGKTSQEKQKSVQKEQETLKN